MLSFVDSFAQNFEIRAMNKENPFERALNFKENGVNTSKNQLIKIFQNQETSEINKKLSKSENALSTRT